MRIQFKYLSEEEFTNKLAALDKALNSIGYIRISELIDTYLCTIIYKQE